MSRHVHIHLHDAEPHWTKVGTPTVSPSQVAKAALAKMPDVKTLQLVRGNGYYYVIGEFKSGRSITSGSTASQHLKSMTVENWVREIIRLVDAERATDDPKYTGRFG